jgi:Putative zinc- or iron-chelating domain
METKDILIEDLRLTSEQQKVMEFLTEFSSQMVVTAFLEDPPASPSILVKELYRFCDSLIEGRLNRGTKLPCRKGCHWCCYLRVRATPLEVLCILDHLQSKLEPGEFTALRQRFTETDAVTRGMNGIQRIGVKKVCPFLVDAECMIYPVRPLACRTFHSLDPLDCRASLDDEQRSLRIRVDLFVISMGMLAGLKEGLGKVGRQTNLLEFIAGMQIALNEPALGNRWLEGDPVFAEAEIVK